MQILNDNKKLRNFFALFAIAPAFLSVIAYEIVDYFLNYGQPDYDPLTGLGMFLPMVFLMEFYTFLVSGYLNKKMQNLIDAIEKVAKGDYNVVLDEKKAAPIPEVVANFNKMTAELRSVETLRSDFINDFSHEFKTPINSINGFANLLLEVELPEEDRNQYLKIIADESARLAKLAEETMMMSRLDNQQHIPDKEEYALDEQIKKDIILLSAQWNEKEIDMIPELESVRYFGNQKLMSHIWINLLNNAIKFTDEKGNIKVGLKKEKGQIYVSVTDTGKGMTKEQCERIFQKYYQADSSHATKGLGLGLSITHRIVELCGGHIEVDSEPGKGSTFTVILPEDTE